MVTVPRLARWKPDNFDISWFPPLVVQSGPLLSHIFTLRPRQTMGVMGAAWTVSSERQGPPPAPAPGESGVINDSEMYLSCPNNCELWTQPSLCRQFKLSHQALLPPPVTRCVNKDNNLPSDQHFKANWQGFTFQMGQTIFWFYFKPLSGKRFTWNI